MSKLSNTTGAVVLAGLTFLSGCRKEPTQPSSAGSSTATNSPPAPQIQPAPPKAPLSDLTPPPLLTSSFAEHLPMRPPIRSTNSVEYHRVKAHLDAFERWLTTATGSPVASKATKRSPENDAAIFSLKYLLNDYNALVPRLHPGQRSWRPLELSGNFRDGGSTEAMVKRTERFLNLVASGKAGREFFFALRDQLEEAYGASPRLHKVLRASLLAENASLSTSPNIDALKRYPSISAFCYESSRRLIEPPSISTNYKKDVQIVLEMQHCLIKLGYDFDVKNLKQTGIRDFATDEALKRFSKDFLRRDGALLVDQALTYKLVSVSTGFDFLLGATLNSEYDGVPYSKDPYKSYCGLTQVTMQEWCKQRGIKPPALFDIKESLLRACYREVFIIPSGCEHLLVMSASRERIKALEIARLLADESYNRSPQRALTTVSYALGAQEISPDQATMSKLLLGGDNTIRRMIYGRAFNVGFKGGEFEEGLSNRLKGGSNYISSLPPNVTEGLVTSGIAAGHHERNRLANARKHEEERARKATETKRERLLTLNKTGKKNR